jgi:hypothetical protein
VPRSFNDIPAGSVCTVIEVLDGGTTTVSVVGVGSGQQVVVPAGGTVTADLTDTFGSAPDDPDELAGTGVGEGSMELLWVGILALAIGAALVLFAGSTAAASGRGTGRTTSST